MVPLLPLAMLAIGVLAGLLLARARPAPRLPLTAEDCVAMGDRAMSEADWPAAAEWLARAHRLAPASGRVCLDLAYALHQIGDADEALRLCEQARSLGASPLEAETLAAIVTRR